MKIAVCSDLHLEFGEITFENNLEADTIILSGDICVAADLDYQGLINSSSPAKVYIHSERFNNLLESCSKNFKHTIMVMGNHEHYHGDFAKSASVIREFCDAYDNVHLLDKEAIDLDGIRFFGGTLWTNFDVGYGEGDESAMRYIERRMNDYNGVSNSGKDRVEYKVPIYEVNADGSWNYQKIVSYEKHYRDARFSPEDSWEDNKIYLRTLKNTLDKSEPDVPFVVVGHHAPSKLSTHPRYKHETTMNTGYSSPLDSFILEHPQIKLWTHGHTHEDFDYMIGSTRVVCNPRGYHNYESRADSFQLKVFEV